MLCRTPATNAFHLLGAHEGHGASVRLDGAVRLPRLDELEETLCIHPLRQAADERSGWFARPSDVMAGTLPRSRGPKLELKRQMRSLTAQTRSLGLAERSGAWQGRSCFPNGWRPIACPFAPAVRYHRSRSWYRRACY